MDVFGNDDNMSDIAVHVLTLKVVRLFLMWLCIYCILKTRKRTDKLECNIFCRFIYIFKLHTYDSFTFFLETWPETF